jgi:hypothetical protein
LYRGPPALSSGAAPFAFKGAVFSLVPFLISIFYFLFSIFYFLVSISGWEAEAEAFLRRAPPAPGAAR